jgi:DNA-binding NarL/FixJ family response regulator
MRMIRLLIVDDETIMRRALAGLLSLEPDFEIAGEASNGAEALALVPALQPDVVLMDVQMPVMDGLDATREMVRKFPQIKILVLTTFDDEALVADIVKGGAHAYLLKDCGGKQLSAVIRSVAHGDTAISDKVRDKIMNNLTAMPAAGASADFNLTERELEVLKHLSRGSVNRDIAQTLGIGEKTVRDHISHILEKLHLRDRTQAALWARDNL